jgi:hypothetical protein
VSIQFILPFGEIFVSQRNTSFDSRYKFTAKELDNETNYTYTSTGSVRRFGAGNLLILVDPDGRSFDEWELFKTKDGSYRFNWMSDKGGKETQIINFSKENDKGDHIKAGDPKLIDTDVIKDKFSNSSGIIEKEKRQRNGANVYGDQPDFSKSPFKNYRSRNQDESYEHGYPGNPLAELAGMIGKWLNGVLYPNKPENDKPESIKPKEEIKTKFIITKHGENTFGFEYTSRSGKTEKRTDRSRAWLKGQQEREDGISIYYDTLEVQPR